MKNLLTLFIVTLYAGNILAQDVHFSQFFNTPVIFNPAATGTGQKNYRLMALYKNQWSSITTPYLTQAASFDVWLMKNKGLCAGLSVINDKAGDSQMGQTEANFTLSSVQQLGPKNFVSLGLQAGYNQRSVSMSALKWGNQYNGKTYDSALPTGEPKGSDQFSYVDFAAGAYFMSKPSNEFQLNAGFAAHHLLRPKLTFYPTSDSRLPLKYNLHGSAKYDLRNTNTSLIPSVLFQLQGTSREIIVGSLVKYVLGLDSKYTGMYTSSALYLGTHYRTGDAIIATVMFDFKKYFTTAVSYDFNLSGLTPASAAKGGMEITIQVPVAYQNQRTSVKLK